MTDDEAHRLIAFMASFCWNCTKEISFEEKVEGNEVQILADFRRGLKGWASAAAIQEGAST